MEKLIAFLLARRRLVIAIHIIILTAGLISMVYYLQTGLIESITRKTAYTGDFVYNVVLFISSGIFKFFPILLFIGLIVTGLSVFNRTKTEIRLLTLQPHTLMLICMSMIGVAMVTISRYYLITAIENINRMMLNP
jgi:hypothetical protein